MLTSLNYAIYSIKAVRHRSIGKIWKIVHGIEYLSTIFTTIKVKHTLIDLFYHSFMYSTQLPDVNLPIVNIHHKINAVIKNEMFRLALHI